MTFITLLPQWQFLSLLFATQSFSRISLHHYCMYCHSLTMIAKQGRFVEFGVFGQETSVDWTIISDAKGEGRYCTSSIILATTESGNVLI